MTTREPRWAGVFYGAEEASCRREIDDCVRQAGSAKVSSTWLLGGIVPHAGWVYSGSVAAAVFSVLARRRPETVVLFGAVHRVIGPTAAVFDQGSWQTPLGDVEIDGELAAEVAQATGLIATNRQVHLEEHSIEVQVPFVRQLIPGARIVPIMVPPTPRACDVGGAVAEAIRRLGRVAVIVGSTDLTHYGPRFSFTPQGSGQQGLQWAKEVNDRRMIDRILDLESGQIVAESVEHRNACGGGAIAATVAACERLGATDATLLRHTTSRETAGHSDATDAVGYAGIVFHTAHQPTTDS